MSAFLHHFNTGLLASVEQIADRVIRYLAPHDDALSQVLEISATECLRISKWIGDKLQQILDEVSDLAEACGRDYEMLRNAAITQISPERYVNLKLVPITTKMNGAMQRIGIVSLAELKNAFPRTADIFWRLFSISRGDGPALRYPTELSEFELRPLILIGESRAFCPSINAVYGAVLLAAENALVGDANFCSRYLRGRDKALEGEALEILRRFFAPEAQIWSGVYETSDAQFEHDIVLADDNLCMVVEAKASPPTEPFRNPEKAFVRLQRAFRADTGLQTAFDQANRLSSRIRNGERVCLYDRNGEQVGIVLPNKDRLVVAACVTRDNFGLLATNLALLLEKKEEDPYPWAANVLDLWSLAEGWEYLGWSSRELRDYLQQRIQLHGKVISDDELDYAGSFIKHGSFSGFAKGNVMIQLNPDYSSIFDEIYRHKYLDGPPVVVERTAPPVFTDFRESFRQGRAVIVDAPGKHVAVRRVGRKRLCACGSGKKFKNCCGRNPSSA